MFLFFQFITARNCGNVMVFTGVWVLPVHGGGGCIPACNWARGCVSQHAIGQEVYPSMQLGGGVSLDTHTHTHPHRWQLKRAVRILLECILVKQIFKRMPDWLDMEGKTLRMFLDCAYDSWKKRESRNRLKVLFEASSSTPKKFKFIER